MGRRHAGMDDELAAAGIQFRGRPESTARGRSGFTSTARPGTSRRIPRKKGPPQPDDPPHRVDLPSPSGWPILAALGLTLIGGGALVGLWLALIGFAVLVFGIYQGSFQPLEPDRAILRSGATGTR